jgi:hypothetical protein
MLDNVTLPAGAKLTNTVVVDLGDGNVVVSSGTTASASGCTITGGGGGTILNGGAFYVSRGATLNLNSVDLTGNGGNQGGAFYIVGTVKMSSSIVSGNTPSNVGKGAFVVTELDMTDCSFADQIFLRGGTASVIMHGANTFGGYIINDSGGGTVTLTSGATLDLTDNKNPTPIAPGGGITLYGGTDSNQTKILFSSGTSSGSRTFERAEIYGSTITNLSLVLGATVTTTNDVEIEYSFDDGATTSNAQLISGTFEVPEGAALVKVYLT